MILCVNYITFRSVLSSFFLTLYHLVPDFAHSAYRTRITSFKKKYPLQKLIYMIESKRHIKNDRFETKKENILMNTKAVIGQRNERSGQKEELSGLPPAITYIGTIEPFYAETVRYFRRLEEAGVQTSLMTADGCFHAFDILVPSAGISKKAVDFALNAYDRYIERI